MKQREEKDSDLSKDGSGIFKDPLMDTVYGQVSSTLPELIILLYVSVYHCLLTYPLQCTSSARAAALAAGAEDIQQLGRMNELEKALAAARASCLNVSTCPPH